MEPDEIDKMHQLKGIQWWFQIFIFVLCLLPLIPLWYFDYLPLQDYPIHFAKLNILSDYEHSDFYRENFRLIPVRGISPLTYTYITLDMFVDKFMTFLDIDKAMKVFISLYVLLYILSLYFLARQLEQDFGLLLLFNLPLIYSSFFYLGFLNFLFSIPLFLFTVWAFERYEMNKNKLNIFLICILVSLVYLTHLFTFFIIGIFLFFYLITKRLKRKEYIFLLVVISLFLIFNLNFLLDALRFKTIREPLLLKFMFLTFQFSHLPYNLFIINSLLFALAVYIILRNSSLCNKHYLAVSAVLFLMYIVLPFKSMRSFIDVRALLFSLILFPLSLKIKDNRHIDIAKLVLLCIFLISFSWLLSFFSDFNKNFSTRCAGEIEQRSAILPVDATKPESSAIRPYLNSWGYFFRHKELLTPYLATGSQMRIEYIHKPPAPSEWWVYHGNIKEGTEFINTIRDTYDYILLIGNDSKVEKIIGSISYEVCSDRLVRLYKIEKDIYPAPSVK